MKRRVLNLRGWLWVLGLSGGVLALFLAPWVIRELRPATSESVFQEARAQLGILRHENQLIAAAGELVRGWVDAGDLSTAREFVAQQPDSVKPYVRHQMTLALIDAGRLDEALREASQLLMTNYTQVYNAPASTRRELFVRLATETINAQRYDDALRVVKWIEQVDADDTHQLCYVYLAEAAADAGRLEVVEKSLTALRDVYFEKSPVSALLLVREQLNQNPPQKALQWLRQRLKESDREPARLYAPLPDSLQAAVDRAARWVRQGRIQAAAQLAEQVLRNYLSSHTQSNADFDLLVSLSARFSEMLPPATMRALLQRLPTERYRCAESHLQEGYLYGLAHAGRWRELQHEILSGKELALSPQSKLWLGAAALAQNRSDLAKQMGIDLDAQKVNPSNALLITYYLLEQGQMQLAKEFVNRLKIPALPIRARLGIQGNLPATSAHSDAILQAIQELALHEPFLLGWMDFWSGSVVVQTPNRATNFLRESCEFSAKRAIPSANRRVYSAILTLLNEGFLSDYTVAEWFLPRNMLWQDCYDPLLADWLLNLPNGDESSLGYGAAAAAQAGEFEAAERLMRKVRTPRHWYDVYRRGYAVGLAKKGEFRAALREARRIRNDIERISALARIAAEMRRQGL